MPKPPALQANPGDFPEINVFDDSLDDAILGRNVLWVLTERELEIFARLSRGQLSKLIAADLGVAPRTVDIHRHRIKKKLKLKSLAEEAVLGWRIRKTLASFLAMLAVMRNARALQRDEKQPRAGIDNVDNSVQ